VIPYVVEVDGQGAVRLVGSPATQRWKPSEGVKRHFLEEWLLDVRELSSDKEVVREDLLEAYAAVTSKAKAQLDTFVEETKPFEKIGKETRQLNISSINKVSEDSYRLEWQEKVYGKSGYVEGAERYVGIITLLHRKPTNREELEQNPLGIYVKQLSINQRSSSANEADVKAEANESEGGQQ
jgi:type IV secretion system protein VirB5